MDGASVVVTIIFTWPALHLIGAAREGLLALSVEVGLRVLRELLELEVDQGVGPKGRWNSGRTAVRHGCETGR